MFANKKKAPTIKSLISPDTSIRGDLVFSDGLRVDGEIIGNIRASDGQNSMLVISDTAHVVGEIHAAHVIVNGNVQGPVHATELLEIQPKARIDGDVHYAALEMHQGARINGQLKPLMQAGEETLLIKGE